MAKDYIVATRRHMVEKARLKRTMRLGDKEIVMTFKRHCDALEYIKIEGKKNYIYYINDKIYTWDDIDGWHNW